MQGGLGNTCMKDILAEIKYLADETEKLKRIITKINKDDKEQTRVAIEKSSKLSRCFVELSTDLMKYGD